MRIWRTVRLLIFSWVICAALWTTGGAEEVLVAHPALTFGDIPYYIAREKGLYREEGFRVEDIYIRGGVTASQALQAGSVHFTLALGSGVRGALSGMTIKGVMVYCDKPYHFLYGRPDLGLRSVRDLKGKKVGVTGLGSTTYYSARKLVQHFGYDPDKDVTILAVGDIWPALQSGSVEAGLIRPPFTNMAEKMGMVKLGFVGDALQIPMSGLVTSEKLIRERADFVRNFVRATFKGLKFFLDRGNEAESTALLNRVVKMEPEAAKSTYEFYHSIMTKDGLPSERSLKDDFELTRLMIKSPEIQSLARAQAEQKMYDFHLLKEVVKGSR